ncbi:seminase-like [Drosophila eugracilis]|uniref:seminase-like n=1 Tax=Drosophila eugracilis TaxID=29029 RepID=UPI0007E5DA0A|nr:seminase-like [Drosophila eugracilis]
MQPLLAWWILVATLFTMDAFANGFNQSIDLEKLAKVVLPPRFQTRVVGGDVTTNRKLGGYLIALRYKNEFICGGTLLHDLIVLTAAHCFLGRLTVGDWLAVGDTSKLTDRGIQRKVKDIIQSVEFRENDMNMDVAILRLKSPMKGRHIGKLSLCTSTVSPGVELVVSGWGYTDAKSSGTQKLLRSVTVPVIDKRICRASYSPTVNLTDSMFCAGVLGKKDACTFDSGGPLVHKKEVCGIVSFGIGCASKRYYGVYTDVIYVKPFIEQSMKILLGGR